MGNKPPWMDDKGKAGDADDKGKDKKKAKKKAKKKK